MSLSRAICEKCGGTGYIYRYFIFKMQCPGCFGNGYRYVKSDGAYTAPKVEPASEPKYETRPPYAGAMSRNPTPLYTPRYFEEPYVSFKVEEVKPPVEIVVSAVLENPVEVSSTPQETPAQVDFGGGDSGGGGVSGDFSSGSSIE